MRCEAGQFPGVFVCGTDTGVGKTVVSSGLVRALVRHGRRVTGLKPVVSGSLAGTLATGSMAASASDACVWEDLVRLSLAGGVSLRDSERSVYRLQFPAAPSFAARREGVVIDPGFLVDAVQRVARDFGDFAVVEGVGGLRVPLSPVYDSAEFARDLGLPAVLVVGVRLGCINHALLTGEGLAARGIALAGWVANTGLDPAYADLEETIATIEAGLGAPCSARLDALPGRECLLPGGPHAVWLAAAEAQVLASAEALDGLAGRLLGVRVPG